MDSYIKRKDSISDESDESDNTGDDLISPYKRLRLSNRDCSDELPLTDGRVMHQGRAIKVLQNQGQLKLSVYVNFGHLTIHVMQGRQLCSKWKSSCNSFIQMSLVPDKIKRTWCKTQVVMDTNKPNFDEKFSFELLEEDYNKRLLISLWHWDQITSLNEFLGCLSFGIRHLLKPKKEMNGWFHLLTEEIGRKKHLHVSRQTNENRLPKSKVQGNIPSINRDVLWMDSTSLIISRGKYGYGFSVVDSCPVKVGRVDKASPAEEAGLCKGDCIIRINGQNVSRSTSDSVIKILKQSTNKLSLDIQRPQQPSIEKFEKSPLRPRSTALRDRCTNGATNRFTQDTAQTNGNYDYIDTPIYADVNCDENYGSIHDQNDPKYSATLPFICSDDKTAASADRRKQEAIHRLLSIELDFIDFMHCGIERYSRPLRHCIITSQQHILLFQNVEKLVTISEYHIRQMQDNVSSCSDTDTTSSKSSSTETTHFINSIGLIYQSKVQLLYQAYDAYAKGLLDANNVLGDLHRNEDFQKFVTDVTVNPRQPSLLSFLYRPVQHIKDLYHTLRDVFECTAKDGSDYTKLKLVVENLQECVTNITNYSHARSGSWASLSSTTSGASTTSNRSHSSRSTERSGTQTKVASPSLVSNRSCDMEVQRIQELLILPPHITPFSICSEDRHLIYTGDLYILDGKVWQKSRVLLFSDLLLNTIVDHSGKYRVMDYPLCLQDVRGIESQREHVTEFVLWLFASQTNFPRNKITFRAPTTELKYTWKSLLEQRIFSCKGNIEYINASSSNGSAFTAIV